MNYFNKNIILHIGLNKTGSTFLQKNLTSKKFTNYFIQHKGVLINKIFEYLEIPTKEKKEDILNTVNEIKEKNILITYEGIAGHHRNGFSDVRTKFKLLEELFDKPKYIIFFREPSSIIYSGFFQRLQLKNDLLFEKYINRDLDDLLKNTSKKFFQTNYRVFNYNKIFEDYIKIQNRVLFVEYEKFFKEKNEDILNNFTGLNMKFNWEKKINKSLTNLIYLEFYNQFFLFKYIKIIWLQINRLFFKYQKARDVSFRIVVLIDLLIKLTPKKYLEKIDRKHRNLLEEIKNYHSKNYKDFKNKLNSSLYTSSN